MRFGRWAPVATVFLSAISACGHRASRGLPDAQSLAKEPVLQKGGLGLGTIKFGTAQTQLPSGLRVGYERTATNGMVGIVITIGAGSAKDPAGQEGLAHFAEHVVFRSKHNKDITLDARLKLTGATGINATTSPDVTTFYAFVPASRFADLAKELGQMLADPVSAIEESDAVTEREVIKNELRQRDETGLGGQMRSWIAETLMPTTHAYRRSIGGSLESVDKLSLAAAAEFTKANYLPINTSVMLVAEDSFGKTLEELRSGLAASWKGESTATIAPQIPSLPNVVQEVPAEPKEGAVTHYAAVEAPTLIISWRVPSLYSEGGHISQIVTARAALDELEVATERLDAVEHANAWAQHYLDTTIISCVVELKDPLAWKDVAKSVKAFYTERFSPYTQDDWQYVAARTGYASANQAASNYSYYLASLRQRTTAESLFASESYVSRVQQLAGFLHFTNNLNAFSGHLGQIRKTSYRELASILPSYLSESHARVVYIHAKQSTALPNVSGTGVARGDVLEKVAERPGEGTLLSAPPRTRPDEAYATMKRVVLPNGLTTIALRKAAYPTVTAVLAFRTGWAASSPPAAERLVRMLEQYRGSTRADAGLKVQAINLTDLSADYVVGGRSNLPHALGLLASGLVQTDATIDWTQVSSSLKAQPLRSSSMSPDEALYQDLMNALYPNSPLAHVPSPSNLRALSASEVQRWLQRSRHPSNAVLVMAGDLEPAAALKWAARIFGQWRGAMDEPAPAPAIAAPAPSFTQKKVFTRTPTNDRPQVEVTIACRLPAAGKRGEGTYDLLAGVVGGWLGTRLREEAGLSYGVSGGARIYRGGASHMSLNVAVDRTHLIKALKIINGHWSAFTSNGFDKGSVSQIRWNLSTASNFGSTTSAALAVAVANAVVRGDEPDYAERYRNDLMAVTDSDLREAFRTCAQTTRYGLVGDAAVIDEAVRAAGL
ncbi:MAG: insulinase family protein [Deltaproteobacteria bacterium]|nr:insulinase family protein [Deltaproteobacteria bacterium]